MLDRLLRQPHFTNMSKAIEIYSKFLCPYCSMAKRLLASKGADYVEYDITMNRAKRTEMEERAPGARTVPQIFIGGQPIGGFDDLSALEQQGKLDSMLADAAS